MDTAIRDRAELDYAGLAHPDDEDDNDHEGG